MFSTSVHKLQYYFHTVIIEGGAWKILQTEGGLDKEEGSGVFEGEGGVDTPNAQYGYYPLVQAL